ncbi:hypothetical protein QTP88_012822 [Uroleucon formosanum]
MICFISESASINCNSHSNPQYGHIMHLLIIHPLYIIVLNSIIVIKSEGSMVGSQLVCLFSPPTNSCNKNYQCDVD